LYWSYLCSILSIVVTALPLQAHLQVNTEEDTKINLAMELPLPVPLLLNNTIISDKT
jgi:hypothetical protein